MGMCSNAAGGAGGGGKGALLGFSQGPIGGKYVCPFTGRDKAERGGIMSKLQDRVVMELSGADVLDFLQLQDRVVMGFSGADVLDFLQGLVTNDLTKLEEGKSMYACFLNSKGRVISDVIVHRLDGGVYMLDLSTDTVGKMKKYLSMTKLRKDVVVKDRSQELSVFALMGASFRDEHAPGAVAAGSDPRWDGLGTRIIAPQEGFNDLLVGQVANECATDTYTKWRMLHGVAQGDEMAGGIPLEFNLDKLNGVSFTKGCYTGQELTARTHFQGLVRKRVLPLLLNFSEYRPCEDAPTESSIFAPFVNDLNEPLKPISCPSAISLATGKEGRSPGKLLCVAPRSPFGLGMLRLTDDATSAW
eukprot:CAMPEP_0203779912 /NCGR_PEP_ID=MMETSP0099_2-20121227/9032_1 /ASSEMBLY_ACC=CAM_ASM_000209 /TAXON_ID=96639 /ORGANISM=" , Strain NY0313808BC1" /LENGTH=358 /DNA_ID=CAMNT_0050680017 /DNA_START=318 /DNA_END=1391 /DNA_ORIENTATION=-